MSKVHSSAEGRASIPGEEADPAVVGWRPPSVKKMAAIIMSAVPPGGWDTAYRIAQAIAALAPRPASAGSDAAIDEMAAGQDGWCDWVHPLPGYRMACCDCGLVHEVEVAVAKPVETLPDGSFTWEDIQSPDARVMWRMRREPSDQRPLGDGTDPDKWNMRRLR